MSITFWTPGAPKTLVHYECMCRRDGAAYASCDMCKGSGIYTSERQSSDFNMANSNALDFLEHLGLEPDYCGELEVEKLWAAYDAALPLLQGAHDRNDEYLEGRLEQWRDLLLSALHHKSPVCWG